MISSQVFELMYLHIYAFSFYVYVELWVGFLFPPLLEFNSASLSKLPNSCGNLISSPLMWGIMGAISNWHIPLFLFLFVLSSF